MTTSISPLQKAFRTLLAAATPVAALVGDKIRPDNLDEQGEGREGDDLPAIVIDVPDDNSVLTLAGGDRNDGTASVQIVCIGNDRPSARDVANVVRAALSEKDETTVDEVFLDEVTYEGVNRDYEPPEDWGERGWYFEALRFFVIYR